MTRHWYDQILMGLALNKDVVNGLAKRGIWAEQTCCERPVRAASNDITRVERVPFYGIRIVAVGLGLCMHMAPRVIKAHEHVAMCELPAN